MSVIPEDVINTYQFANATQLPVLKTYLTNHYNLETLRLYKNTGQFLTKEEILTGLPNKIIEFYSTSTPVKATKMVKEKFWTEDEQLLAKFREFLSEKYKVSDSPDTKFKDLMVKFGEHIQQSLPVVWSKNYETMCANLDIKFDKIVNPRFQGSSGTCHVFLRSLTAPKVYAKREIEIVPVGTIPDIF